MNRNPPDYLLPLLLSIEKTVMSLTEEFPVLVDKDIEWSYNALMEYFLKQAKGKQVEEPLSTSERKQAIVDELLNLFDLRQEDKLDEDLINNPDIQPNGNPIPSLAALYATALKYLRNSVRFWRKERGAKGYLSYIKGFGF